MGKHKLLIALIAITLLSVGANAWVGLGAEEDEQSERQVEITVPFTESEWWLTRWADNQIECVILTDHDGLPTADEVYNYCGKDLYEEWAVTQPCPEAAEPGSSTESCEGLYLFLANRQPRQRTVVIELPHPTVWLTLSGCDLRPPENLCTQIPDLVLTAEEPLPNEQIIALHLKIGDDELSCEGNQCAFTLPITSLEGMEIEFWADSSYGDSSEVFKGQVRVVDGGVPSGGLENVWYVDVLSSQWRGGEIASCAQVWEALPPVGGPPPWLSTPTELAALATDAPYVYLAGKLISQGTVDASACPSGGLLPNGTANTCGLETAREMVNEWQDRFDDTILKAAQETNIPAQLMKNLFAIESQFWPGSLIPEEFGFGQLTELGADAALLWNDDFFREFCPLVLEESACAEGYLHLDEKGQALLRGAIISRTNASCAECPLGIDLAHAEFSINVFANTLLGNCEQVGRIVRNTTEKAPGKDVSYEDLWRFTLVNYNAGPGCLSSAVKKAWQATKVLRWDNVASRLAGVCEGAVEYVDRVERLTSAELAPTPTAAAPTPTVTAPGPTPTPGAYPPPSPYPPPDDR